MSAGRRPRHPRQLPKLSIIYDEDSSAAPELNACLEVVTAALGDPNRALLRRVFFIAEDKSKYVLGFYPGRDYQPLAEFGGAKKLPLLLNAQYLQTLAGNITALCDALSTNEHFSKKDGDFKMNTTGSYTLARVYLDKHYLSYTYEELRNLAYIMYMIQNQMKYYIAAMTDVMVYIDTAHDSVTFVEPPSTADKSINYYQLFEEIKSVLTV